MSTDAKPESAPPDAERPESASDLIQHLLDRAHRELSPGRMLHVLGVTHTITTLAALHKLNLTDAALAGLLHDQSKQIPHDRILEELKSMGYDLAEEDRPFPHTWHGLHAAAWAERHLGLSQPEIFEAVNLHTTADAGVGRLTKALFIADMCEPGRKGAECPAILRAAREDLDEGFRQALMHKMRHVIQRRKGALHPRAVRALRHFTGLEPDHLLPAPEVAGGGAPPPTRHDLI